MMAETYDELLAEIDRVVKSPYPTQLKVSIRNTRDAKALNEYQY